MVVCHGLEQYLGKYRSGQATEIIKREYCAIDTWMNNKMETETGWLEMDSKNFREQVTAIDISSHDMVVFVLTKNPQKNRD